MGDIFRQGDRSGGQRQQRQPTGDDWLRGLRAISTRTTRERLAEEIEEAMQEREGTR